MKPAVKTLLWILGVAAGAVLLWYLRSIIVYLLISAVLSLMGRPILKFLDKIKIRDKGLPSGLKAATALAVMGGVLALFFSLVVPVVAEEARLLSQIDMEKATQQLDEPLSDLEGLLGQFDMNSDDPTGEEHVRGHLEDMFAMVDVSKVFRTFVGSLGNLFLAVFSIVFITFFFLKDRSLITRIIFLITPKKHVEHVKHVVRNAKVLLTRYFLGILAQVVIVSTLATVGMLLLGVKNAFVIGFFAGLMNVIPYVGPLIGAFFGAVIGMSGQLHLDFYTELLPLAGKIAGVFLIIQLLDNFVLQPVIFSNSVKMHPLEVFLVILIGGTLASIPGMILAIPSYTIFRVVAAEFLTRYPIIGALTRDMDIEPVESTEGAKK